MFLHVKLKKKERRNITRSLHHAIPSSRCPTQHYRCLGHVMRGGGQAECSLRLVQGTPRWFCKLRRHHNGDDGGLSRETFYFGCCSVAPCPPEASSFPALVLCVPMTPENKIKNAHPSLQDGLSCCEKARRPPAALHRGQFRGVQLSALPTYCPIQQPGSSRCQFASPDDSIPGVTPSYSNLLQMSASSSC